MCLKWRSDAAVLPFLKSLTVVAGIFFWTTGLVLVGGCCAVKEQPLLMSSKHAQTLTVPFECSVHRGRVASVGPTKIFK